MLDLSLDARRGSFRLRVECRFASDWTVISADPAPAKVRCCAY